MNTIYEIIFGRDPSHPAIEVTWEKLEDSSVFTMKELKRLFARYVEICDKVTGELSMTDFVQMPELIHCPFAAMAFEHESVKHTNPTTIDFTLFVRIISKLSLKTLPTEKVDYLCEILGSAESGSLIDEEDFKAFLFSLWCGTMAEETIEPLIASAWDNILTETKQKRKVKDDMGEDNDSDNDDKSEQDTNDPNGKDTNNGHSSKSGETITRGEMTSYLSSLDLQNFITAQF